MAGEKKWNLGKDLPEPKKTEAPKKPATPRPQPERVAPPKPAAMPEDIDSSTSSSSSQPVLGRPVPPPKSPREYLNHPLTLIASGLVICVVVFLALFRGSSGGDRQVVTLESADAVKGLLGDSQVQQDVLRVEMDSPEPQEVRDARLILAAGQTLEAIANHRDAQARDPRLGTDTYLFVPPAIAEAPLPESGTEHDRQLAGVIREEARYQAYELGKRALDRAVELKLGGGEIRAHATRLLTEGLAVVERTGDETILGRFSGARGAGNRLQVIQSTPSEDEIGNLLRGLFDPEYAEAVLEARRRTLGQGGTGTEANP